MASKEEIPPSIGDSIKDFLANDSVRELALSSGLTAGERRLAHDYAEALGLGHISVGTGDKRHILLQKKPPSKAVASQAVNSTEIYIPLSARKRFVKDFSLPVPIVQSPFFEYFVDLYQDYLSSKSKLAQFVEILKKEQSPMENYNSVSAEMIARLKETDAFKRLSDSSNAKMAQIQAFQFDRTAPKTAGTWAFSHVGKHYISLDLIKANFHSLQWFDKELVLGCETWEALVAKFSPFVYFAQAKYFRQVVFGNLNPKKIGAISQYLIFQLHHTIKTHFPTAKFVALSNDELILEVSDQAAEMFDFQTKLRQVMDTNLPDIARFTRMEYYQVGILDPRRPFFIKELYRLEKRPDALVEKVVQSRTLKAVPNHFFAQAYKRLMNLEPHPYDRKITFEGFIATLDSDIFATDDIETDKSPESDD